MSSKKPISMPSKNPVEVSLFKTNPIKRYDPRFGMTSGNFNMDKFKERYQFLEPAKVEEIKKLKLDIKKETNSKKKRAMERKLAKFISFKNRQKRIEAYRKVKKAHKESEIENLEKGKSPFYLKKAQEKQYIAAQMAKESNKKPSDLIVKLRKKTMSKQKSLLPQ